MARQIIGWPAVALGPGKPDQLASADNDIPLPFPTPSKAKLVKFHFKNQLKKRFHIKNLYGSTKYNCAPWLGHETEILCSSHIYCGGGDL